MPPGAGMIRTSYMATHTTDHLDRILDVFEELGREFGVLGSVPCARERG